MQAELLKKAKRYAFLLLKYRPRSEKEICQRLKKTNFDDISITETVSFLKKHRFIDDDSFAESWIEARLKKPLGISNIREELRLKGISGEIIDSKIRKLREGYCETRVVAKLAQERFRRIKGVNPKKAKQRIFSYLLRRGFSAEAVTDAVEKL